MITHGLFELEAVPDPRIITYLDFDMREEISDINGTNLDEGLIRVRKDDDQIRDARLYETNADMGLCGPGSDEKESMVPWPPGVMMAIVFTVAHGSPVITLAGHALALDGTVKRGQ